MPWFPFYVGDFLSSPKVRAMSCEEVGAYLFLLCEQHQNGFVKWPCERKASALRTSSECIAYVLEECFAERGGKWYNARMTQTLIEQRAKSSKSRESAKRRWDNDSNANAMPTHSEGNASQSQIQREITTTAAAVFGFLKSTGCVWRLKDRSVVEWAREIESEKKYSGADLAYEIKKAGDWHAGQGKKPKAPDTAIRNWLERAAERTHSNGNGKPGIGLNIPLRRLTGDE